MSKWLNHTFRYKEKKNPNWFILEKIAFYNEEHNSIALTFQNCNA